MPFLIGQGGAQFKSLRYSAPRDGWDTISAVILYLNTTVSSVKSIYPRHAATGSGFFIGDSDIRTASRLPGGVYAEITAIGCFSNNKLQATGAASAHSESPTGLRIPALSATGVFDKTNILICDPTFEIFALDAQPPDIIGIGRQVSSAYGGISLSPTPANPFAFDPGSNATVSYPNGWCYTGVEYEQVGTWYLKRYYYAHRHLLTP